MYLTFGGLVFVVFLTTWK